MGNNLIAISLAALVVLAVITTVFVNKDPPAVAPQERQEAAEGEILLSWGKLNYAPEIITVQKGEPVRIRADLKRVTGCFRAFKIAELGVEHYFSERAPVVEFTPEKQGTFLFGCQMGMGQGVLVVA